MFASIAAGGDGGRAAAAALVGQRVAVGAVRAGVLGAAATARAADDSSGTPDMLAQPAAENAHPASLPPSPRRAPPAYAPPPRASVVAFEAAAMKHASRAASAVSAVSAASAASDASASTASGNQGHGAATPKAGLLAPVIPGIGGGGSSNVRGKSSADRPRVGSSVHIRVTQTAAALKLDPDSTGRLFSRTLALTAGFAVAMVTFVITFGPPGLGFGMDVLPAVNEHEDVFTEVGAATVGIVLLLYLSDARGWSSRLATVAFVLLVAVAFIGGCTSALLAFRRYPVAPMSLYLVLVPGAIIAIKATFYRNTDMGRFLLSVGVALGMVGFGALVMWLHWVLAEDHPWNDQVRANYSQQLGCLDDGPPPPPGKIDCPAALLVYLGPLIASVIAVVFALLTYFLSYSVGAGRASMSAKIFALAITIGAVSVWSAASIAGAGTGLSSMVMLLIAFVLILLLGITVATVRWDVLSVNLAKIPLIRRMTQSLANWLKALFVLGFAWLLPFYLVLSFANQRVRQLTGWSRHHAVASSTEQGHLWLTLRTTSQLAKMSKWNWTSVCAKMMFIGYFYILFSVGVGRLTTLLLSVLNEELAALSLGVTSTIFFLVGITMFLLPPVPGVPVYVAGGVILVKSAWGPMGFEGAIAYTCGICFLIKMLAITIQQKLFGERLSHLLSIRTFVGVNSLPIRATRRILERPGFSPGKVFILIGGPDWPTSVLTGILRLPLGSMLFGSLPVGFMVIPCVLAGAFLLRVDEGGAWESCGGVALAVAALSQMFSLVAALYYIEQEAEAAKEELEAMPLDEEVAAEDARKAARQAVYKSITRWQHELPLFIRCYIVGGATCVAVACYMLLGTPQHTFKAFQVTDSIKDDLDGSALNLIVSPGGYVVIGLVTVSIWLLVAFKRWAAKRVKLVLAGRLQVVEVGPVFRE
eukprot:m.73872 g.73872  ORF g.73872 m.73872 type:complete len:928 (-) comp14390_c0_seq2:177-2960(-)